MESPGRPPRIRMPRRLRAAPLLLTACLAACLAACDAELGVSGSIGGASTVRIAVPDGDAFLSKVDYVSDELLIQVIPGSLTDAESLASSVGAQLLAYDEQLRSARVRVAPESLAAAATRFAGLPEVESVEKDYYLSVAATPSDPRFPEQWHLARVAAEGAWDLTTGDAARIIAIVDTGIDSSHPDLRDRLIPGFNFVSGNSDANDCCGHGTAVAGVAGAIGNNALGVSGVTWNGKILPVRVAEPDGDTARARTSDIARGILWAADQGAAVINVSFTGLLHSRVILNACHYAVQNGALVVAAMGNEGERDPVADSPWLLGVSASDAGDNLAVFSTFGPGVDLAAPGQQLLTTARFGSYRIVSGTSFAAPLTSGVVALMRSIRPEATPLQIEKLLLGSVEDLGPAGFDEAFGHGLVNAAAAVQSAQAAALPPDNTPPTVRFAHAPAGVRVGGATRIELEADDDSLVRYVVLLVDGVEVARDFSAPYAMLLNPFRTGTTRLSARAVDLAGNGSAEAAIDLIVENDPAAHPPEVSITAPAAGDTVSGEVTVAASLSDAAGLRRVALLLDGEIIASGDLASAAARVEFTWNASSAGVAPGPHVLGVMATSVLDISEIAVLEVTTAR